MEGLLIIYRKEQAVTRPNSDGMVPSMPPERATAVMEEFWGAEAALKKHADAFPSIAPSGQQPPVKTPHETE